MFNMQKNKLVLALTILTTPLMHAVCNQGSLTQITGSPFTLTASGQAAYVTYSPVVNGTLYAAVTSGSTTVSIYQVNATTGAFTQITGSPFTIGGSSNAAAYSPLIYGQLFLAVTDIANSAVRIFQVNLNTGAITAVSGSPFSTGTTPQVVAFSPLLTNGMLFLAVANATSNSLSVFQVNTFTGALTGVTGSPFSTGVLSAPFGVVFSPLVAGNLFAAVANSGNGTVGIYQVNTTTGAFTAVSGSPFTVATTPLYVAFSPAVSNNLFLAATNSGSSSVSAFNINTATGVPTAVTGSPFTTGIFPHGIGFSPLINNNLFAAVANFTSNTISMYQVNTTTGVFTPITGTFSTGSGPQSLAFSPILSGGVFLATPNNNSNTFSVFQLTALTATITTLSQYILNGNSAAINGTLASGTAPYTLYWQDNTQQTAASSSFSRTVSPTISTVYNIASMTDTNACLAGASNAITIAVRTCP